jgi:hypothetical protein
LRVAASVSFVWFSSERTTFVVADESRDAGNPGTLGMTKRRGLLEGKGGCWRKGRLLEERTVAGGKGRLLEEKDG